MRWSERILRECGGERGTVSHSDEKHRYLAPAAEQPGHKDENHPYEG
ncbi:hypothetical protein HQN89_14045 [Paenibacillus frigoriresistens]|nr:hypothetical protein [Paenibacillus frigoriresistens]NRF92128.1 hypothetical protein [Paenibacillus frigoriresistens]